jgi:hypothetical protein
MFDPAIFDNEIFDTPVPSAFHFGRVGRKFERGLSKLFSLSIPIRGIPIRLYNLALAIAGIPLRIQNLRVWARGVAYRNFNKDTKVNRKRRYTMLELEALEL